MRETKYQTNLIKKIMDVIPGSFVLINDPRHIQGIPDVLVLYKKKWAALEVKIDDKAEVQPNQKYYVDKLGEMSFASFIHPGNEEDVLRALQHSFGLTRKARVPKP